MCGLKVSAGGIKCLSVCKIAKPEQHPPKMTPDSPKMTPDEVERLIRKLNYHESIIVKLLSHAHSNSKIVVVKEKIEQLEEMVLEIPDLYGDQFEQWMDTVVCDDDSQLY